MQVYKLVLLLIILFVPHCVFSKSQERMHYRIINVSNENIMLTITLKEHIMEQSLIAESGRISGRYIYETAENRDVIIYVTQERKNMIISHINTFINGRFYWKHHSIFERWGPFSNVYERDENFRLVGEVIDGEFIPNILFIYRDLTGKEIFNIFFEVFTISDMAGNIILTLEDITEDMFIYDYVEQYVEEYVNDFYNTYRYSIVGNNIGSRFFTYGLFITSEIIEQGRMKHIYNIIE